MKQSILILFAALSSAAAHAQTMDGCFILTFEPGTQLPVYDCTYQKRPTGAGIRRDLAFSDREIRGHLRLGRVVLQPGSKRRNPALPEDVFE
jgi:hypothetical protein